jgi:hypothetical protein
MNTGDEINSEDEMNTGDETIPAFSISPGEIFIKQLTPEIEEILGIENLMYVIALDKEKRKYLLTRRNLAPQPVLQGAAGPTDWLSVNYGKPHPDEQGCWWVPTPPGVFDGDGVDGSEECVDGGENCPVGESRPLP